MAIFGFGKDKKDAANASDQVLAYLEDAQRTRAPFTLVNAKKHEVAATIQGIDEGGGQVTFQLSGALTVDKGAKINFTFIQESLRLGATCRVADQRANLLVADLPEALELQERRSQPRARLNPKEGTTLTALTGIFDGVGISGVVENLSEGGARVRVDKAMNIKGEKRLPLGTALLPPGQPFVLVKLNKAPKCPAVIEMEGKAVFLDASQGGLTMGIAFSGLKSDQASALRSLVASRTTAIPAAVPAKARRRPEPPPAETHAQEPPAPAVKALPAPEAVVAAAPVEIQAPAPAQVVAAASAPEAAPARNDMLMRLKKRSRAVVVLAPTPAAADMIKDHLQEEGYGRTLVTTSPKEFMEFLQQPNLAVLFIDGDMSTLEALQFISQAISVHPALPPIILAVEEASTAIVLAARRAGVAQILLKPYLLDANLVNLLNQQMEL